MNSVQEYVKLGTLLHDEAAAIRDRLAGIDAVLGGIAPVTLPTEVAAQRTLVPATRRRKQKLTMREAITEVTAARPLGVAEIVDAMRGIGYKFKSKTPRNSVGAFLYGPGKKHFRGVGGKFGPR